MEFNPKQIVLSLSRAIQYYVVNARYNKSEDISDLSLVLSEYSPPVPKAERVLLPGIITCNNADKPPSDKRILINVGLTLRDPHGGLRCKLSGKMLP